MATIITNILENADICHYSYDPYFDNIYTISYYYCHILASICLYCWVLGNESNSAKDLKNVFRPDLIMWGFFSKRNSNKAFIINPDLTWPASHLIVATSSLGSKLLEHFGFPWKPLASLFLCFNNQFSAAALRLD